MTEISVRLACADYARIMPLASGTVKAEGIDLSLEIGRGGSWPIRADLLRRAAMGGEFDGGEGSMGAHLRRVETGDRSFVALPVFILRGFTMRDLYVRKDGPVRSPRDLIEKRLGLYNWFASGGIWYRHAQVALGVPLDAVEWHVGDIEIPGETQQAAQVADLPSHVRPAPAGRFLAEMLIAGEIDAMWSPPRPKMLDEGKGPIVRLFPDFRAAETEYYRNAGIFPMMHIVVLRRSLWERAPWVARSLTNAFAAANDSFDASQRGFPDAFPWMEAELDKTTELLGSNPYGHGLTDPNRKAVQAFIDQALDAGIIGRSISVDEYFEEFLQSQERS
jgi:4,5-dihydroxyphthalate decarboxylase